MWHSTQRVRIAVLLCPILIALNACSREHSSETSEKTPNARSRGEVADLKAPPIETASSESLDGTKGGEQRKLSALNLRFNWCPAGSFVAGSAVDVGIESRSTSEVNVKLTHGFWMGSFEVTQQQYEQIMKSNPSTWTERLDVDGRSRPVESLSWKDAVEFCQKLTETGRADGHLPSNWEYRLPTEAQWEFACRANSTTAYCFGDDFTKLDEYAWFDENSMGMTHEVGQKKPNAWGLHDMHGNVWEWCRDRYAAQLAGGTDPIQQVGEGRVVRGGCYNFGAQHCQASTRNAMPNDSGDEYVGFRVAIVRVSD